MSIITINPYELISIRTVVMVETYLKQTLNFKIKKGKKVI